MRNVPSGKSTPKNAYRLICFRTKKRKHKKQKKEDNKPKQDIDCIQHGNWWKVSKVEEINGPVAIEFGKHTYVKALDNGLFTLGAPHDEGDGPAPEEILTAVAINERKVAFKSGYNKYLLVDKNGIVVGRSDAIGAKEQWEPVIDVNCTSKDRITTAMQSSMVSCRPFLTI